VHRGFEDLYPVALGAGREGEVLAQIVDVEAPAGQLLAQDDQLAHLAHYVGEVGGIDRVVAPIGHVEHEQRRAVEFRQRLEPLHVGPAAAVVADQEVGWRQVAHRRLVAAVQQADVVLDVAAHVG
jgi:hypothetical protein